MGKLDKESYLGKKYHFRYYRKSGNHPFLVAIVIESELEDGKAILSGFNMTRSIEMVLNNPTKFIRIQTQIQMMMRLSLFALTQSKTSL